MNLPNFRGKILIKAERRWDVQRVEKSILLGLLSFSKSVETFLLEMERLVENGELDQMDNLLKARSILHPIKKASVKTGIDPMGLVEVMSQVVSLDHNELASYLLKILGTAVRSPHTFRIKDPDDSFSQIIFCSDGQQELFNVLSLLFILGVERSFDGRGEVKISC